MSELRFVPGDDLHAIARKILSGLLTGAFSTGDAGNGYSVVGQANPLLLQSSVSQPNAASLQATVAQSNPTNLHTTATQGNPASLNATVVQPIPANLQTTATQANPANLNATVAQGNPSNLNATVVGNTGGFLTIIKDVPTVTIGSAYSNGNSIGGKRTLVNAVRVPGGSGILHSLTIVDRSNHMAASTMFLFDSDPTAAATADKTAFAFNTDDFKVIAQIPIIASDYVVTNGKGVLQKTGLDIPVRAAIGTSLYAVLVAKGSFSFVTTTDVQIAFGIQQN